MRRPKHGFGRYFEEVSKGEAEIKELFRGKLPTFAYCSFLTAINFFDFV